MEKVSISIIRMLVEVVVVVKVLRCKTHDKIVKARGIYLSGFFIDQSFSIFTFSGLGGGGGGAGFPGCFTTLGGFTFGGAGGGGGGTFDFLLLHTVTGIASLPSNTLGGGSGFFGFGGSC
jgi:hypothetical protein